LSFSLLLFPPLFITLFPYTTLFRSLILVIILYLGSHAAGAILGAQALHNLFSFISVSAGLVMLGLITFIITLFGYELIHIVERYLTIIFAIVYVIVTIVVLQMDFPAGSFAVSEFH